jgi:type I protein arginine methyltransferase
LNGGGPVSPICARAAHGYLRDSQRLNLFRQAIGQAVRPGDVVADLGCGFGVLGLMCLKAGAARVWGIDRSEAIEVARETMDRAGWGDRYRCIREHSFRATLPERVDVLVCDHVGYLGLDYGIVEMVADARQRLLKPGGRMIPTGIALVLAGVSSGPCREKTSGWAASGIPQEYHWLRQYEVDSRHAHSFAPGELCTEPVVLGSIDLGGENPGLFAFDTLLIAGRDGQLDGLAGWFDCALAEQIRMTNSPLADGRIDRDQVFLPFDEPIAVKAGDAIEASLSIRHDAGVLTWSARHSGGGRRRKHSNWRSRLLDRDHFELAPDRVRELSREGRARQLIAGYFDGKRTGAEIERAVLDEHPGLFPSEAETLRFIRGEIARNTR